ncbi:MAG: 4Fe-4S dicluster domain-containing protein, partial [Candidatus Dormibacteraeota bacterium]|nr:4Fe-4S dicluster domain-containing protein [Candidatus Dormibacteraeota bacterium]
PDPPAAGRAAPEIMPFRPIGLEHFNQSIIEGLHEKGQHKGGEALLPEGEAWLLVEFGGDTREESEEPARRLMKALPVGPDPPLGMKMYEDDAEEKLVWDIRENGVGASRVPPKHPGWPGWEDAAVPPDRMGDYLADFIELCNEHGYRPTFFGHVGEGCVHTRMNWDLRTVDGVANMRSFMEEAADVVVKYGGSLSGEHGDGQKLAELLPKMFGHELVAAFSEFKAIWDPERRMNPGKVVSAFRLDQNLRENPEFQLLGPATKFSFKDDGGSFAEAAGRCFGVGKCRHVEGGTMCPSFMVTREEIHSTRGRSRLLNEMMTSVNPRQNPWRDDAVKEALDLCLACKGCKGECPAQVDMATYKAEFLSHYYQGRPRPRTAYAMGLIMYWSRLAGGAPRLANVLTRGPLISHVGKALAGITAGREVPAFAHKTFKGWWARRVDTAGRQGRSVVLWPDTFNDHFHPETLIAGVEVLEAAGFRVVVPKPALCCGRPLFDYGMLDTARRMLARVLEELRPEIRAGTPLVGLEPSCVAVFRDELTNLFPHDQDAQRLSRQSLSLGEFLESEAPQFRVAKLEGRRALFHGHCHQKALWGTEAEVEGLKGLGLEVDTPDSGCCGLAGSFGYEAGEKADVADRAGERVLAPAVRGATEETLIVADGFSCRSQIEHLTERRALHSAEVLQLALHPGSLPDQGRPEERYRQSLGEPPEGAPVGAVAALAAGAVTLAAALAFGRRLRWSPARQIAADQRKRA